MNSWTEWNAGKTWDGTGLGMRRTETASEKQRKVEEKHGMNIKKEKIKDGSKDGNKNGMNEKQRTGDVLDCLLGRKDASSLTKTNKDVVSLSDTEETEDYKDSTSSKRLLHNVREHPSKKIKNPYTKFSDKSATGKLLDDSISEPLPTDGRQYIDEYMSVPNSCMKPKRIYPTNYTNPRIYNHKQKKKEEKIMEERKKENKKNDVVIEDSENNNKPLSEATMQRLQKDLMNMTRNPPKEIVLDPDTLEGKDLKVWKMELKGPRGTSYYGERYNLECRFNSNFPKQPPLVTFVGTDMPNHPQVNDEGRIILPTLTNEWNSTFSVRTICSSIISMLLSEEDI